VNRELAEENTRLKELMQTRQFVPHILDSLLVSPEKGNFVYNYVSARVINNSVNRPFNYITLNKGRKHGIKPDQGIVSADGIVGVITNVSESYSVGLSVLNQRWSVSARLKSTGFFGSLSWDGRDYRYASLNEIPFHVQLTPGDTVVTSGFSTIFPEGIMIGIVDSFEQPAGENYYQIKVKLSANVKTLSYVEIIENVNKTEIEQLENLVQQNERAN
jgi:rod shape-determining protein MreC